MADQQNGDQPQQRKRAQQAPPPPKEIRVIDHGFRKKWVELPNGNLETIAFVVFGYTNCSADQEEVIVRFKKGAHLVGAEEIVGADGLVRAPIEFAPGERCSIAVQYRWGDKPPQTRPLGLRRAPESLREQYSAQKWAIRLLKAFGWYTPQPKKGNTP